MDAANLYGVESLRRSQNASRWWKGATAEAFSRSSRKEDDEEALKWAVLEKLPTYDRIRKGMLLSESARGHREVDIQDLNFQERKNLLERLIRVAEEDNEKLLLKLKHRMDRGNSLTVDFLRRISL